MKEKSSCALIQDLLSYRSMSEESIKENEPINENAEAIKELDYLKKIRTKSRKKICFSIGGVIVAILLAVFVKLFVYGSGSEFYVSDISLEDGKIKVQGVIINEDLVYSHCRIVEQKGQKKLVVYAARASFWNKKDIFEIECSMEEIKEGGLVVEDCKITSSGNIISRRAADIYANRHPFIGDMPKNQVLSDVIGINQNLGSYTNELQTKTEPYGWTFNFQSTLKESNEGIFNEKMRAYAYVLLATVDNLGEVTWSYMVETADGSKKKDVTFTVLEAEALIGEDIKLLGQTEEGIEELLVKVGINQDGKGKV